ncbi:MAG: cupin domain-containing protein [Alistipes indistinctus]
MWSSISRALGTRLGTILDGEEHYEPVVQLSTDRTPSINLVESENLGSHLRFSALAQNKTDRNMEPFFINVSYCPTGDLPSHHEGEEFLYVLEGSRYSCFTDRKPIRWRKATASVTIRSCRITSRRWPKGKRPKCWP